MKDPNIKSLIAQNCDCYGAKLPQYLLRIGIANESCYNCQHFIAGQCSQNLYQGMETVIKTN